MTKSSRWLLAGALASFGALFACGNKGAAGSGSNGTGNGGNGSNDTTGSRPVPVSCLGSSVTGSDCASCVQSSCEGLLGAFGYDCSAYVDCYCPNGTFSASAQTSRNCVSQVTKNASCVSSLEAIDSCVSKTCGDACRTTPGGAPDAGDGGSENAGDGGPTMACGIAIPSAACASCFASKCCQVTQACASDPSCQTLLTCFQGCDGGSSCEQKCIDSAPAAARTELGNTVDCWSASCPGC